MENEELDQILRMIRFLGVWLRVGLYKEGQKSPSSGRLEKGAQKSLPEFGSGGTRCEFLPQKVSTREVLKWATSVCQLLFLVHVVMSFYVCILYLFHLVFDHSSFPYLTSVFITMTFNGCRTLHQIAV